jgi:hypothetical protein
MLFPVALAVARIGILAFVFVLGPLAETKGRSLEQIEADLRTRG